MPQVKWKLYVDLNMTRWICAAILQCAVLATGSAFGGSQDQACGPPNYCARSDRRIEAYPKTPPRIGPAGSIISDPSFGSRIVRVTDEKADPYGRGRSFMTPSSAEQNPWNSSGTRFYVLTSGGQLVLYAFDPEKMAVRRGDVLTLPWREPEFSYTQPNTLYGMSREDRVFQQYDISNGHTSTIHKTSTCMKLDSSNYGYSVTVSADDSRLSTSLGPGQDKNFLIYVYDRKQGCRWYNTRTGEIGGQWGPAGTIRIADRGLIHNSRMSKSGKYIWIARDAGEGVGTGWLVWKVETMNVEACPAQCSGHHAMGYSHLIGPSGQRHPMDLLIRPLDHLDATKPLVTELEPLKGAQFWYDMHFSWNNVNPEDTNPACFSTYSQNNPDSPGAPLNARNPWENEVLCVETDGKASKIWRFSHTYSTARNGFWSSPRGNVSPDGRFFMFTSDWQDELGEAVDDHKPAHRTDVFIVELR